MSLHVNGTTFAVARFPEIATLVDPRVRIISWTVRVALVKMEMVLSVGEFYESKLSVLSSKTPVELVRSVD